MRKEEQNIRVETIFSIQKIKSLRIIEQEGEHSRLFICGVLLEKEKHSLSEHASIFRPIRIYATIPNEEELLFTGVIENIETCSQAKFYTVNIEAVSYSIFTDLQRQRESYQDKEDSYQDVLDIICARHEKMNLMPTVNTQKKIPAPLLEYEETDWQFLKRLISHFHTKLYVDCKQEGPSIYFGFPTKAKHHDISTQTEYTIDKDLLTMEEAKRQGEPIAQDEFLRYSVELLEDYHLGDEVVFLEKTLRILRKESYLKGSLLYYRYSFGREIVNYQLKKCNANAFGLRLEGRVIDTKGECVKVHLHIDEEQPIKKAYWFPFAPPTGSLMYCMPQHGTEVSVYFPELNENEAMVYGCVRRNGQECFKTSNTDIRYLGTEHGSEMEMEPTFMHFNGKQETDLGLNLTLADALGVSFTTPSTKMLVEGKEGILISSAKTVNLTGAQVSLVSKMDANVVIDGEINVLANTGKTYFDGSDSTTFASLNEEIVFKSAAQIRAEQAARDAQILADGALEYKINDPTYDAYGSGEIDQVIDYIQNIVDDPNAEKNFTVNPQLNQALKKTFPNMPDDPVKALDFLETRATANGIKVDNPTEANNQLIDLCKEEASNQKVKESQKERAQQRNKERDENIQIAAETVGAENAYPFLYELSNPYNSIYIREEGTPGVANSETVPAYLANAHKRKGDVYLDSTNREITLATQQVSGSIATGEAGVEHLDRLETQGNMYGFDNTDGLTMNSNMVKTLGAHASEYQKLVDKDGFYAFQEKHRKGLEIAGDVTQQVAMLAVVIAQTYGKQETTAKRNANSEAKDPATVEEIENVAESLKEPVTSEGKADSYQYQKLKDYYASQDPSSDYAQQQAQTANWKPMPDYYLDKALNKQGLTKTPASYKEKWTENGYNYEVRVHSGDANYTNSKSIYRVGRKMIPAPGTQGTGQEYMDINGKWWSESVLKPFYKDGTPNPNYNAQAAKDTHIPVK